MLSSKKRKTKLEEMKVAKVLSCGIILRQITLIWLKLFLKN